MYLCIYIFICVYVFIDLCGIYQVIFQPFRCWERLYVSECDVFRRQDHIGLFCKLLRVAYDFVW